jgi:simple sugar transport system ATP-binding protein
MGILDRPAMIERTSETFGSLAVPVTRPSDPVRNLSGGQRQAVAIARAAMWATKVVLLDEPTAALSVRQRQNVLKTVARLRDRGLAVLLVTDRVTVMRRGEVADTEHARSVDVAWVIRAMIGSSEIVDGPEEDVPTKEELP